MGGKPRSARLAMSACVVAIIVMGGPGDCGGVGGFGSAMLQKACQSLNCITAVSSSPHLLQHCAGQNDSLGSQNSRFGTKCPSLGPLGLIVAFRCVFAHFFCCLRSLRTVCALFAQFARCLRIVCALLGGGAKVRTVRKLRKQKAKVRKQNKKVCKHAPGAVSAPKFKKIAAFASNSCEKRPGGQFWAENEVCGPKWVRKLDQKCHLAHLVMAFICLG